MVDKSLSLPLHRDANVLLRMRKSGGIMQVPPDGPSTGADGEGVSACPFHAAKGDRAAFRFDEWLETDLRCSAGRREFQLDRYVVEHVRNGYQFSLAFDRFAAGVVDYRKTGFMAIVEAERSYRDSVEELRRLGQIIVDAGFADSAGALIRSQTVAIPIELDCPVTGLPTQYEFFPVAFCCHAGDPGDPLYDPSLSAPFLAINTTSDAFAFGMLVRDLSYRHFHCAPHEIAGRGDFERLLARCVSAWQNMSVNTIQSYQKVASRPERAVGLSEDHRSWHAPHNDPVFAELAKERHSHEMPVIYARRLADRWTAALYEGVRHGRSRDGQSGGIPIFDQLGMGGHPASGA